MQMNEKNELERHTFVGVKGDLRVELHWKDVGGDHGVQACLYVHKANDYNRGVLLPFSDMWRLIEADHMPGIALKCAEVLYYGSPTQSDLFRIQDVIFEYLQDLKDHKPAPDIDKTLDQFLEECEREDLDFFIEDGAGRRLN
jgi:hypothetical protein